MTDLSILIIVILIVSLVILPTFLAITEKFIVIAEMEEIKDIIDLAVDSVAIELNTEYLSYGELGIIRKNYESSVRDYLKLHLIEFDDVKVKTFIKNNQMDIIVDVVCKFKPHVFRMFLPRGVEYEITRKYELFIDR